MRGAWLTSLLVGLTIAGPSGAQAADAKAAELVAQARAAIGRDKRPAPAIQGLSCTGIVNRVMGERQISGELRIDLQLPDKLLRTESISPMGDAALIVTEQGVSGDTLLRNTKLLNTPPGAVIRTPPPPSPGSEAETQALRNSRAELARFAIAMLLDAPASAEFAYAGEAESPDGKADVLDIKGAGALAAKLFLDKNSHRPLMLSYRGVVPRMVVRTETRSGLPDSSHAGHPAAEPPAPEVVDITMFFDDYKTVDGILLPHHVTRAVDGQTNEEWTFKTIAINPAFNPDTFARK